VLSSSTVRRTQQILYPSTYVVLAGLILFGIHRTAESFPLYWSKASAIEITQWAGACLAIALAACLAAPRRAHLLFVGALLAYILIGVGLKVCVSVALFVASSYWCGRLLLKAALGDESEAMGFTRPFLVGLACELALFGVLIHVPWNSGLRYLLLVLSPFACSFGLLKTKGFWAGLGAGVRRRADALNDLAPFWLFVLCAMPVAFAARYAFFPTIDYDNNNAHLRIWAELTYRHLVTFDVTEHVWNAEPFLLDLSRAIPSLMAGADARGAMALALYALILHQLWRISEQLPLQNRDRLLLLALLASTPMTGWMMTAATAELIMAFLATAGVRLMLECRTSQHRIDVVAILAVAAMCAGAKLPGVILGVLLLLTGVVTIFLRRDRGQPLLDAKRQWPILLFLIPFAVTALDSYATSWRVSGNPLLPLYNGVFKSPYFAPSNFSDTRWMRPLTLKNYVLMFFRTSHYGEHENFVAGFQFLFLLPLGLIALFRRSSLAIATAVSLPIVGFGLLMFSQIQYMRYMYPIAPLATLAIAALLIPAKGGVEAPSARVFIALCIALNLFFYPGVSWIYSATSPQRAFNDKGKARVEADLSPAKSLVDGLNTEGNRDAVLFPEQAPFGSGLQAKAVYVNWYAPEHEAAYQAIHSVAEAQAFLVRWNVKHVIVDKAQAAIPGAPADLLRAYLDQSAVPIADLGGFTRYDLFDAEPIYRPLIDLKQLAVANSDLLDLTPIGAAQLRSSEGFTVTEQPLRVAHAITNWARIMRYRARFRCKAPGQFIAQVNWDKGPPFYRLVTCDIGFRDYEDTFSVPAGALHATLYATVHGTNGGVVSDISLDSN
jgi:hypothetical protein